MCVCVFMCLYMWIWNTFCFKSIDTCINVLQYVAIWRSVLQCDWACCSLWIGSRLPLRNTQETFENLLENWINVNSWNAHNCMYVLQCGAVWCSVVQYVAVCCSVLQCVAVCCSVVECVAVSKWSQGCCLISVCIFVDVSVRVWHCVFGLLRACLNWWMITWSIADTGHCRGRRRWLDSCQVQYTRQVNVNSKQQDWYY